MNRQVPGSILTPGELSPLTVVMRRPQRIRRRRILDEDIDDVIMQLTFEGDISPVRTELRLAPKTPVRPEGQPRRLF